MCMRDAVQIWTVKMAAYGPSLHFQTIKRQDLLEKIRGYSSDNNILSLQNL